MLFWKVLTQTRRLGLLKEKMLTCWWKTSDRVLKTAFFVFIEVFEGKFNFSKNSLIDLRRWEKNFFLEANISEQGCRNCVLQVHILRKEFLRTFFFDLRTLSQSVSVSVVKIFNKLVKTAIQMFRWKLSLNCFPQKITLVHHHRKFRWIFLAFRWKFFTCNVKTAL